MFYTKKTVDTLIAAQAGQLEALVTEIASLKSSLPELMQQVIQQYELNKSVQQVKLDEERQKSDQPFVEIISDRYDPELGVQLQLDWNQAFIKELKSKGYTGRSERELVNKWVMAMHKQIAEDIEKQDRV